MSSNGSSSGNRRLTFERYLSILGIGREVPSIDIAREVVSGVALQADIHS
jgi:hypothetical protein